MLFLDKGNVIIVNGDIMELDNFHLEKYSPYNKEHKYIFSLINGTNYGKYLGDLELHIKRVYERKEEDYFHNDVYVAFYNDNPVGFISLSHREFGYEVVSGIIPSMRGEHLGPLLLQEFSEKVFDTYDDVDELVLKINPSNKKAISSARLVGYEKVGEETYIQRRR